MWTLEYPILSIRTQNFLKFFLNEKTPVFYLYTCEEMFFLNEKTPVSYLYTCEEMLKIRVLALLGNIQASTEVWNPLPSCLLPKVFILSDNFVQKAIPGTVYKCVWSGVRTLSTDSPHHHLLDIGKKSYLTWERKEQEHGVCIIIRAHFMVHWPPHRPPQQTLHYVGPSMDCSRWKLDWIRD